MLTKAERKVYDKAMLGFNPREIGKIYKRHPARVRKVLVSIYKKYNVHSIQQLMALRIANLEDQLHSAGIDYE